MIQTSQRSRPRSDLCFRRGVSGARSASRCSPRARRARSEVASSERVIAVLVAAAGRPVSVDSLLQAIYGDDASPSSRATLHTYVSNLRSTLGDVIIRRADAYLLDWTVRSSTPRSSRTRTTLRLQLGSADDMASQLRLALSMWRGHPYADIEAHGHLDGQITRLNELRLAAIEARVDADLRAGRHRDVVAELDALTVEYPFRESLRAMHMLALYRSGRQGDALRAYARHACGARRGSRDRPVTRTAGVGAAGSCSRTASCSSTSPRRSSNAPWSLPISTTAAGRGPART